MPTQADPIPIAADGVSRRSAIAAILGLGASLVGAFVGLTGGFLSNAFGHKRDRSWIRVGAAEDLNPETFQRHIVSVEHTHAWLRERRPLVLYIRDFYPKDPVVLHARCSHLGCSVKWENEGSRFLCPCHGGIYAEDGAVLKGPPPRPLTRLEVKIEGEVCYVRLPEVERKA